MITITSDNSNETSELSKTFNYLQKISNLVSCLVMLWQIRQEREVKLNTYYVTTTLIANKEHQP